MKSAADGSPLFRKIMLSILLASVFFLSLLTAIAYLSYEFLEDELLTEQTDIELRNTMELLAQNPDAAMPRSASLAIYLDSRQEWQPVPQYLVGLSEGVHHDFEHDGKAYHVLITRHDDERIYIQLDVTEFERSEKTLQLILLVTWMMMIVALIFIARSMSRKLSAPIAQLSQELSLINPDERGVHLGERYADDEVGRIARAFDSYTEKMDGYVEKQIAFAAMASHELRSPLTIVQTSADLIANRHDNPEIEPHLEKIQRASANMTNMIHALLAVTRDQPTQNTDQPVALRPLVEEIIDVMGPEICAKQIRIDNRLDPAIRVNGDKTLLTVVLTNLIKNGVKHGQQSSISIDMQPPLLTITDSGIGIDGDSLKKIFDFGFRGQNSQGYGVGLYISRLICDYQGWSLDLEQYPGGGIVAKVGFPD